MPAVRVLDGCSKLEGESEEQREVSKLSWSSVLPENVVLEICGPHA